LGKENPDHMDITDIILDRAFAIYEEFGPNRMIARGERLKQEFPGITRRKLMILSNG
jgi:hypothetical protein